MSGLQVFQPAIERIGRLGTTALIVLGMVAITHFGGTTALMAATGFLIYTALPTREGWPEYREKRVSGTVTQTISADEIDGYAIYGELKGYVKETGGTLTTIRTGYESKFHKRLADVPVLGWFARADAEHAVLSDRVDVGDYVEFHGRSANHETTLEVLKPTEDPRE